jgi:hypothetical protein
MQPLTRPVNGKGDLTAVLGTSTSIACTPSPDSIDAPAVCTARVSGGGANAPTGLITWTTDTGVAAQFDHTTCTLGAGATCGVTYTPGSFGSAGSNTLTASYAGDIGYLSSSGQLALGINKRTTSATVVCSPNPVGQNATASCTATVADTDAGSPIVPQGNVSWSVNGTGLGTCPLDNTGACSINYQAPSAGGTSTFVASYAGDTYHNSSTSPSYDLAVLRPTSITVSCTPSTDTVGAATTCSASVTDTSGNSHSTPSGTVTWTVSPNAGAFSTASGSTFTANPLPGCVLPGNGNSPSTACSVTYIPGSAGAQTITATYVGDPAHIGNNSQTPITVNPAPASNFSVVVSTGTATAGTPISVTVTAKDQFGNVATNYTGTVHFASTDNTAMLPANYTFRPADAGAHTFSGALTLKTAGNQTVTATDTVNTLLAGTSDPVSVGAAAASKLALVASPTTVSAGANTTITVTAQDQFGNTAPNYTGRVHFGATDAQAALPVDYTFSAADAGSRAFSATLKTTGSRTVNAADVTNGSIAGTSNSITVTAAAATTLSLVASVGNTTAGAPINLTLTARDQFGNVAAGYTGAVHFSSTDANAILPADYAFTGTDAGIHTFTAGLTLKTAGSQTATATDAANAALTASTNPITVGAAATSKLTLVGPAAAAAGTAINVSVTAQDQYGNTTPGYTGSVHFTSSDAQAALPANYTFVAVDGGTHTFSVTLKTVGSRTVTGTDTKTGSINGTGNPISVTSGKASSFSIVPTTGSTTAGTPIGATVTAFDQYGNIATGYTGIIHFSSTDLQAALPTDYTFTASDAGVHVFAGNVTLKTRGNQTVSISDNSSPVITASTSPISVNSAAATNLSVAASTTTTTAGTPINVMVTARDPFGNTATGYTGTIHFTGTDSQGVLPANYTFTGSDSGQHTFTGGVTFKTAGNQTVAATDVSNANIVGASDPVSVSAASAASFNLVGSPNIATAGASTSVTVTVLDQFGNLATNYTGTVRFSSTDAQAGLPANYAFNSADAGSHTFTVTFKTAGGQNVTTTDTITSSIKGTSNQISVNPAAVSQLFFTVSPSSLTAGGSVTATVAAKDQFGNVNPGYTGTVHFTSTDPQAVLPVDYAFKAADAGTHTFSGVALQKAGGQTITATDASNGALTVTSPTITVAPATANKLYIAQQPGNASATAAIPAVIVQVQDSFGNIVTSSAANVGVTILAGPNNSTLSGTRSVPASGGVATFSTLSIDKAGSGYTLLFSSSGLASATSSPFNITVGSPSSIAFTTQPASTSAGATFTPAVQVSVLDAGGNTVTTSTAPIALAISSGGSLGGTTASPASGGVATFSNLSITSAGSNYTLTASTTGLPNATSATFNVAPGTATKLGFIVQPSTAAAGSNISPAVQVAMQDAFGNTVTSSSATISVAIENNPANGVLAGSSPVATSSGVATFSNLWINKVGTGYTLAATATAGLSSLPSAAFNITPGTVSANLSTVSASPSSVPSNGQAASSVTVTLVDAYGNVVSGKPVTLSQPTKNHSVIAPATATTDGNGQVVFTVTDSHTETVPYTATGNGVTLQQTASVTFT